MCEKAKVFGAEGDGCVAVSSFNFLLDQLFCVEVRVDAEFFGEPVVLGGVEVVPHLGMVRENRLVGGDWKLVAHVFMVLSFRFHAVQVERNCSIKRRRSRHFRLSDDVALCFLETVATVDVASRARHADMCTCTLQRYRCEDAGQFIAAV